MTNEEKEWIEEKYRDLAKWIAIHEQEGKPDIQSWDNYKFMKIINVQAREIRKLKTQAFRNEKA